jgi:hypothetical protein
MKKLIALCFLLSACGAIGIGKNTGVTVYNNSESEITARGNLGNFKIQPGDYAMIQSESEIQLHNANKKCAPQVIPTKFNTVAVVLDIVPGFVFGIIPLLVDLVAEGHKTLPSTFSYDC